MAAPQSGKVACWANRRSETQVGILCKQQMSIYGFMGVPILRTCKNLNEEGTEILYGENKFVFNAAAIHGNDALKTFPDLNYIFDKSRARTSSFLLEDPLLDFMHRVGRQNAAYIKCIKLEGPMKTVHLHQGLIPEVLDPGLALTLPVYTAFLRHVCLELREITLQIETRAAWDGNEPHFDMTQRADDPDNTQGLMDQQRVDEIVGRLVTGLPSLRKLRLGEYALGTVQTTRKRNYEVLFPSDGNIDNEGQKADEWEGGLEWIDFVDDRERNRIREVRNLPVGEETL